MLPLPKKSRLTSRGLGLGLAIITLLLASPALAQPPPSAPQPGKVQEVTGHIRLGENIVYSLPKLQAGQMLYLYLEGVSGNLDPLVAILKPGITITEIDALLAEEKRSLSAGDNPLVVIPEVLQKFTRIWDDDSGKGHNAVITYEIPQAGDYQILVRSTLARETFGDYRLLIGLNAPRVATGQAQATGAAIAVLPPPAPPSRTAVENIQGKLTAEKYVKFFPLRKMQAGETLYVYTRATAGDLKPSVTLYNFSEKPLASGNFKGQETQTTFTYTFPQDETNCRLKISGRRPDGAITIGDFALVLGVDAPEVLTGQAKKMGHSIIQAATPVKIGLKLQEITVVDQKAENFNVVAALALT